MSDYGWYNDTFLSKVTLREDGFADFGKKGSSLDFQNSLQKKSELICNNIMKIKILKD